MVKVSIIMPVYNKEAYVKKSIQSVINQSFKAWELIIIDDGSKDNSLSICKSFKDDRIRVISVENGGASKARNLGLDCAKGEYITFIDSDDYVSSDYLENLYKPEYDFIISGVNKIKDCGEVFFSVVPWQKDYLKISEIAKTFYKEQSETGIFGYVAGKLFRRNIVVSNDIKFDHTINLAEDYDFYLKIYNKIKGIYFTDYIGYFYLENVQGMPMTVADSKIDFLKQIIIQQKAKKLLEKYNAFDETDEDIFQSLISGYVYTMLIMSKEMKYNQFKDKFKNIKMVAEKVSNKNSGIVQKTINWYNQDKIFRIYLMLKIRKILGR